MRAPPPNNKKARAPPLMLLTYQPQLPVVIQGNWGVGLWAGRNVKEGSIHSWALGLKWWPEEMGKQHAHKKAMEREIGLSEPPSDKGDKGDLPNSAALRGEILFQ